MRERVMSRARVETDIPCVRGVPHRYMVALMAAISALITVGTGAAFALVITRLTEKKNEDRVNLVFTDCTGLNAKVHLEGDMVFLLHTTYYISFTLGLVPGSILGTLFSTTEVAGWSVILFSVATWILPFAIPASIPFVFVLCIILGATEGAKQPAIMALIAAWSTKAEKTCLYGIYTTGVYTAPALSSFMTATTLCFASWDGILFIYGCLGIMWGSLWLHGFHDTPALHPNLDSEEAWFLQQHGEQVQKSSVQMLRSVPWKAMLTSRGVWAVFLGSFSRNIIFAILVVQQAQYFNDAFNIRAEDFGLLSIIPYVGWGVATMTGGLVSDKLIDMGHDRTNVRRTVLCSAYAVEGVCLAALFFVSDWRVAFGIICCGIAIGGMAVSAYAPLPSDMAPQYTSVISGLAMIGTLGAVLIAAIVPGKAKTWQIVFLVAGIFHLASAVLFFFMVDARLQPWAKGKTSSTANQPSKAGNTNNSAVGQSGSEENIDNYETAPLTESSEDSNNDLEFGLKRDYKTIDRVTYEKILS